MGFIEDIWKNQPLLESTKFASSLAYDLIALRDLFESDITLTISYKSILTSISKENSVTDRAIRTLLMYLKTLRSTHLQRQVRLRIQNTVKNLEEWLDKNMKEGSGDSDFINSLA